MVTELSATDIISNNVLEVQGFKNLNQFHLASNYLYLKSHTANIC